jgi:hypothetical protein
MPKISKSPERNTFQRNAYLKQMEEQGKEPDPVQIAYYDDWISGDEEREEDPTWQKTSMEYTLRTSDWILEKVRKSDAYAQNLYAAMCNMEWQKLEVVPILKEERWGCSWRYAGGIVADMQQKGDYIDWYCSGINGDGDAPNGYVEEGVVTAEIKEDLHRLGWAPSPYED